MKFLILGATGMGGHLVATYLKERGHEVDGYSRNKFGNINSIIGDVRDIRFLSKCINNGYYDSVINLCGLLNNDCEEDKEGGNIYKWIFASLIS